MASRGTYAQGTDGSDFQHRQRVVEQYQVKKKILPVCDVVYRSLLSYPFLFSLAAGGFLVVCC